jgi:hypothetical protein
VLAAFAGKAPEDRAGWRRVVPAPMHWIGLALGTGLVLLMVYIRLFVGSRRADAASQMTILTWLVAGFAVGTIILALSVAAIRRRAVRWRGGRVVWRRGGREVEADLASLDAVGRDWLGYAVLHFADGKAVRLDPYARGASELLEAAAERLAPESGNDET